MTDLEVLNKMVNEGLDISASTTMTDAKTVKQGGKITMGVDRAVFDKVCSAAVAFGGTPTHVPILYVVNYEQFQKLKNENP